MMRRRMKLALFPSIAVLFAALMTPSLSFAQSRSTNIGGNANVLQGTATNSAIIAGRNNTNGALNSVIAGGVNGSLAANLRQVFLGGGNGNSVLGGSHNSAIVSGRSNTVNNSAVHGFIGGGEFNEVRAPGGAVVGGFANEAAGTNSFAAGSQAVASNTGTFVWADMSSPTDFVSTGNNQFLIRAAGGVGINTANPQGNALFVAGNLRVTGRIVSENNQVSAPGAAVAGGRGNLATNNFTFVGGGENNIAGGLFSIVVGGGVNTNRGGGAFIGGGFANSVTNGSSGSVIGGGIGNRITISNIASPQNFEAAATIAGGARNEAAGYRSTVGGGEDNRASSSHDIVAGGRANAADGGTSAILGGFENAITNSSQSAIVGGFQNRIDGGASFGGNNFIGGGEKNTNRGTFATIGGGANNTVARDADNAVIGGGISNVANGRNNTVGGGTNNRTSLFGSTVAGGAQNTASGRSSTVGGGTRNTADNESSTVGGGSQNRAGFAATVGGGQQNTNTGMFGAIGGGFSNRVSGNHASVAGGDRNVAAGALAIVPGGSRNFATNRAFAAGVRAKANHDGAFVWSGVTNVDTVSTNTNSFTVRAPGGVRFISVGRFPLNIGVILPQGAVSWESISDSNAKTAIKPIKPREILAKLASMPVTEWRYKGQPERKYIGPMGQDFHAAFGLGSDDKTISTLDSDGVMYAAIQGLVEELKEKDKAIEKLEAKSAALEATAKEVDDLKARNTELSRSIEAINKRLNSLPPTP